MASQVLDQHLQEDAWLQVIKIFAARGRAICDARDREKEWARQFAAIEPPANSGLYDVSVQSVKVDAESGAITRKEL